MFKGILKVILPHVLSSSMLCAFYTIIILFFLFCFWLHYYVFLRLVFVHNRHCICIYEHFEHRYFCPAFT